MKNLHKRKFTRKSNLRSGFTLIEVIIVTMIIGILAAVAIPSLISFIEYGKQVNRMNIARTIYLAAQNQLTEKRITKNLLDYVTNSKADSSIYTYDDSLKTYVIKDDEALIALNTNVSKGLGSNFPLTDFENKPYVHYISKPKGDYPDSEVCKLLAPVILDKSILNEAILIEYNVKTGVVMSVFYGDTVDKLGYGTLDSTLSKNEKVDGTRLYNDARDRRQGYYGVGETYGLPDEVESAITINVYDGAYQPLEDELMRTYTNVLYAKILIPKHLLEEGQKYNLRMGSNIFLDAFTNAVSSSYRLSTLMSVPAADHIIYKINNTTDDYDGFIWILDYVGEDMTNDTFNCRSIGVKFASGLIPDKNMTISLISESGVEVAYSNEFNPCYVSDINANYRNQIKIKSARHLYNMRYKADGKFALISDIDLLPANDADKVSKIASTNYKDITENTLPFTGTFTGQNYSISNLNIQGNGFFEAVTGRVEYLTIINPNINAAGIAGVLAGVNGGSICDVIIISDSMDAPVSGGTNVGGVVGMNKGLSGSGGRISRVLYLAVAPEKNGIIYPITSAKEGTIHNPSVIYLSGSEIRPQPIIGGVYNPSVKALADVGTAKGTDEICMLGVGGESPFKGYTLNAVPDPKQATDKTAEQYPYQYLGISSVFDGFAWPITGGNNVSLRYYEVYTDNSVGYYYYDFETSNFINTLKNNDNTIIKDDGYIVIANSNISLTFGSGTASIYSPANLTLGLTSVKAVKINDSVITSGYTTPISITGSGLPANMYFNPLFATQIFVSSPAPGIQGGTGKEIEIRSPRQLANITKSANITSSITYHQTLDINFAEYRGFDQYKPNASDEFTSAIVNAVFSSASTYDGMGKKIIGVKVNTGSQYSGVFSKNAGTIRNVNIYNSDISGANHVGALVGENQNTGTLSVVSAIDTRVAGTNLVGGLVGTNTGTIQNAFASYTSKARGAIDLNPQADSWVAGVVRTSGYSSAFGGLVGSNGGTITNVYVASYAGGDNDNIVKPVVGSGSAGTNVYYLYGNNFNSNTSYSPAQGTVLRAYELSALVGNNPFNDSNIWNQNTVEYGNYPYPVFTNAQIPTTWCAPTAPTYPLKYYEIYQKDNNQNTLDYGLWGGADDDTLQYNRPIIADGYLLFVGNIQVAADTMSIFAGNTPNSETTDNLYKSNKKGIAITGTENLFGEGIHVVVLPIKDLEEMSLGLSPVYLKLGTDVEDTAYFEGWVNPLFGKAIFNAKPSANYEYIVRTPRHLQNVGYALSGKFRQETDIDFTGLNAGGYCKVENPNMAFSGGNITPLSFIQAGVQGVFSGSYNASYQGGTKKITGFNNTNSNQSNVGIFAEIAASGRIENLLIVNSKLSGTSNVGGVAGDNKGVIKNVHVICSNPNTFKYEASGSNIGGITGTNSGTIEMCAVENQSIKGLSSVGGIIGSNAINGTVQDVYYVDTRSTVSPLASIITASGAENPYAGGIVGYNFGTVTSALYLGIAPKVVNSSTLTTIYPIVGGGNAALKHEGKESCFYAAGSAYSLTKGTNYVTADYNFLSEAEGKRVELFGGGFGYDTAFLELEFVAMMDASANWDNWTYGVRVGSKPYPYAIVDGMTPPENWHEVSGSGKPPQEERTEGWKDGTEGASRSRNLTFINPDFDLPLISSNGRQITIITNTGNDYGRNMVLTTGGTPNETLNTGRSNPTWVYYEDKFVQGWNARTNASSNAATRNSLQLMTVFHNSGSSLTSHTTTNYGRVRTDYKGNTGTTNNSSAGVHAELSAAAAQTLFQICETVPGTELYYSFYHASRGDSQQDSMNFYLSGVANANTANINYTNGGMQLIRPCLTKRGTFANRYTRYSVSYAYRNGSSGTLYTGINSNGQSTFYDPNTKTWRTAYLYDLWIGPPAGNGGYGITFWSNTCYTVAGTGGNTVLPNVGLTDAQYGTGAGRATWTWVADARNVTHIIGYWDAVQFAGTASNNNSNGRISEWKQYYGKYTIPAGQVWTEFAYQHRYSTSGDAYGNLLDGINFEAPSYVTVSKALDGVSTLYRNPGESAVVTLTAKNWGEVAAKGIIITDTIKPFDEYADMPKAVDNTNYKIQVWNAPVGNAPATLKETINATAATVKYVDGMLTVTIPETTTLATNETVTVTFTLKVRETLKSNVAYDTLGYYVKNQAEVSSLDAKYPGYERTNAIAARADKYRLSNIVQMYIDPIQLEKTAVEVTGLNEKDAYDNAVQYYDITLHMESTFAERTVRGLINDAIPEGFKVVSDVTVEKTNDAIVSTPRVVENGDGTTTVVVSNLVLDDEDKVTIKYRLRYTGEKYGTVYSNIEANYKYQFAIDSKQMTGAVAFPKPAVAVNIKTQDDVYRVASGLTDGIYLNIGANDYATDAYHLSQGEYDTVDRYYMLLLNEDKDEDGRLDEAGKNVNGQYEITGTGYTATLIGDQILLKTTGAMPNAINIKYRVALTAVSKGMGDNIDISSRDTYVKVYKLGNDLVYYEKYANGDYGLYFANDDTRNTLNDTLPIEESGYAVLSAESAYRVRVRVGTGTWSGYSVDKTPYGDAYLYKITAQSVTDMTLQQVNFTAASPNNNTVLGKMHPYFAKAVYTAETNDNNIGNSLAIRTPEQMQNISRLITFTGGKTFTQERALDFSAVSLTDSVVTGEFKGTYDGGGNNISNVFINAAASDNIALFSQNAGVIKGVKLTASTNISGKDYVGGIAGINKSGASIMNCTVEGNEDGSGMHIEGNGKYVGGITGLNEGTVKDCTVQNARYTIKGKDYIGGIAGQNSKNAAINNVIVRNVSIEANGINIGALVGENKNPADISSTQNNVILESPKLPLKKEIEDAAILLGSMIDDNEIGNYLSGTKAAYQAVVDAAKVVLDLEDVVSEDIQNAITSLYTAKQNLPNNMIYRITLKPADTTAVITVADGIDAFTDRAVKGKTVIIDTSEIMPPEGKALIVSVTKDDVKEDEEPEVTVSEEDDNKYTFIMPEGSVTVTIIDLVENGGTGVDGDDKN